MSSSVSMKFRTRWLIVAALATVPSSAFAQPFLCTAIRPGETAAQVAARITGEPRNTHETWFQIVDPAASRFVPKTRYDNVRAGWRACVATGLTATIEPRVSSPATWALRIRALVDDVVRTVRSEDPNVALWVALLALIALATHGADDYFRDRQQILKAMQQFSEKFVREFERPLAAGGLSARPIQSRLRFAPHSSQLEIWLTPGAGHRYPNLTDHRNNVEYDLKRIMHVLNDRSFTSGRPYMDGPWVVLPFQLKSAITEAGGR